MRDNRGQHDLRLDCVEADDHGTAESLCEIVVDVDQQDPETVAMSSIAFLAPRRPLLRLRSTYVSYGEPPKWRAIHLPLDATDRVAGGYSAASVKEIETLGEAPSTDHLVLDHLHEMRSRVSEIVGYAVSIELGDAEPYSSPAA